MVEAESQRVTVGDLVSKLEAGVKEVTTSDGWRQYLELQSRVHSYSLGNTLLIMMQRPDATMVGGFHFWLSVGRHVRKGEHGIRILAPIVTRKPATNDGNDNTGDGDSEERLVRGFRTVTVFDISQTDGDPLPDHPCQKLTTDSERGQWLFSKLLDIANTDGIAVRTDAEDLGAANGAYYPSAHTIAIAVGLSVDQKAKTLCHELAHSILHRQTDKPRAEQEAEAEGTAFVVAAWAGLDTSAYSLGYVAEWASHKDGPAMVKRVGGTIQKTASTIIDKLEEVEGKSKTKSRANVDCA